LSAYVTGLTPADFVLVPGRGHLVAAHLVRTFVYKLGACHVLVGKETPDAPATSARCWATSDLDAPVAIVAGHAAARWDVEPSSVEPSSVEPSSEQGKELLGLDHYQLTSATAIERFWPLVACA
jgi:hypothetical protein